MSQCAVRTRTSIGAIIYSMRSRQTHCDQLHKRLKKKNRRFWRLTRNQLMVFWCRIRNNRSPFKLRSLRKNRWAWRLTRRVCARAPLGKEPWSCRAASSSNPSAKTTAAPRTTTWASSLGPNKNKPTHLKKWKFPRSCHLRTKAPYATRL